MLGCFKQAPACSVDTVKPSVQRRWPRIDSPSATVGPTRRRALPNRRHSWDSDRKWVVSGDAFEAAAKLWVGIGPGAAWKH